MMARDSGRVGSIWMLSRRLVVSGSGRRKTVFDLGDPLLNGRKNLLR